jgi:DnaK suppressor protein
MSSAPYQRVLQDHLALVEAELADRRRAAAPSGERPGFGKRAGDYVAQVVEDRTNNQLADNLAATADAIRRALALIDEGRFGRCQSCGDAIAPDRLQAVPWAPLCLRCQSADEHSEGAPVLRRRKRGTDEPAVDL